MAVRQILSTDTLDRFRTQFNEMTQNDFGDIATLDPALSATTVIGAVNELSSAVSSGQAFFIEDNTSSVQQVAAGQTLHVRGSTNQINAVVTVPDTLTISLPDDVTITQDLTVIRDIQANNNITATNRVNAGTLSLYGQTITDSSGTISFGSNIIYTTGTFQSGGATVTSLTSTGAVSGTSITGTGVISGTELQINSNIVFEGSINDNFETTLTVANPTADRTITLPDRTGTVITSGDVGTVTSTMLADGTIVNADIANATIRAAKLNLSTDTLVVDTLQANAITGTASIAQLVNLAANNTANEVVYLTFADGPSGNQSLETDTDLTYNPSTNILTTTASQAQYADLAEYYSADVEYAPGTVVMFGGDEEVTIADKDTKKVAGVISTNPAYVMNGNLLKSDAISVAVALQGRVPCKVIGKINKGDMIVSAGNGLGMASDNPQLGQVIGKALENYNSENEGTIEVVIGRL